MRDIIICMYVLVHTHHASVQEKWVEFFGVSDSDIRLASFCWNAGPKTNPNIQKKSSKHIQNHRAMHRTQYPESRYIYNFFCPRSIYWRPVSPLLGFYYNFNYSIHLQPLNGDPSCLNSVFLRELMFPTWYSRSFKHLYNSYV